MKEVHQSKQDYRDVYYDSGNGEFQLLTSELVGKISQEIEIAIHSNPYYEHDYRQVSKHMWAMTSEYVMTDHVPAEAGQREALRERTIQSYTLYRDHHEIDQVQTIVLGERQYAQQVMLEMASEHIGDLTEVYMTSRLEERYIIERSVEGMYRGYVEQFDMIHPRGERHRRPMTLYDGAELLRQIEDTTIT